MNFEDSDEWDADWDAADSEYDEDDMEDDTQPCPYCHAEIYDDAQRCPVCEQYLTDVGRQQGVGQPLWVKITVLLLLALFAFWALAPLL